MSLTTACDPNAPLELLQKALLPHRWRDAELYTFLHRNSVMLPFSYNVRRLHRGDLSLPQCPSVAARIPRVAARHERIRSFLKLLGRSSPLVWGKCTLLKGLPVAALYPETCRDIGDVDLFVGSSTAAAELLRQFLPPTGKVDLCVLRREGDLPWGEVAFHHTGLNLSVGIMFGNISVIGPSALRSDLVTRRQSERVADMEIPIPSWEDALLLITAGVLRHGYCKLRDLLDVRLILNAHGEGLDLDYLQETAAANALDAVLSAVVKAAGASTTLPSSITRLPQGRPWEAVDRLICRVRVGTGHRWTTVLSPMFVASHLARRMGGAYALAYGTSLLAQSLRRWRDGKVYSGLLERASFVNRDRQYLTKTDLPDILRVLTAAGTH